MKNRDRLHRARLITFILLALYFSLFESLIPKPFPWLKIGLANLVTIIVMAKYGFKMALEVSLFRIFIQSIMLGTFMSVGFLFSLSSGVTSLLVMGILFNYRKYLSIVSISITAAFFHNLIQLVIVYTLFLKNIKIYTRSNLIFIMTFLLLGILSGGITGVIGEKLNIREEKK